MEPNYTCPHCNAYGEHNIVGVQLSCRVCDYCWNQSCREIVEGLFRVGAGPEPGKPWKSVKPRPLGQIKRGS